MNKMNLAMGKDTEYQGFPIPKKTWEPQSQKSLYEGQH